MFEEMRSATRKVGLFNFIFLIVFACWVSVKQFIMQVPVHLNEWKGLVFATVYTIGYIGSYMVCRKNKIFLHIHAYVAYPVFLALVWYYVDNTDNMYSVFYLLAIPLIEFRHLLRRTGVGIYSFITLLAYMYSFYASKPVLTFDEAMNNIVMLCVFMIYIMFSVKSIISTEISYYEKMKHAQDISSKINEEKEMINILYENVKSLSGTLNIDVIAEQVNRITSDLVWHKTFILITVLDENTSTFQFYKYAEGERINTLETPEYDFIREVLTTNKTVHADNKFGMPLYSSGNLIGAIIMEDFDRDILAERYHLLHVLGDQIALVVNNAMLYFNKELESITDGLTKVYNKRYFDHVLNNMIRSNPSNLYLLIYDIDFFKKFNDTYGHRFGDVVLIETARTVQKALRDSDFLARYGGEEFVVLFEAPNDEIALKIAERVRQSVEKMQVYNEEIGQNVSVTISIGVGRYVEGWTAEQFVEQVDKCLYESKALGRNRTTIYVD